MQRSCSFFVRPDPATPKRGHHQGIIIRRGFCGNCILKAKAALCWYPPVETHSFPSQIATGKVRQESRVASYIVPVFCFRCSMFVTHTLHLIRFGSFSWSTLRLAWTLYAWRTEEACMPFWPCSATKVTASPSFRDLKPSFCSEEEKLVRGSLLVVDIAINIRDVPQWRGSGRRGRQSRSRG